MYFQGTVPESSRLEESLLTPALVSFYCGLDTTWNYLGGANSQIRMACSIMPVSLPLIVIDGRRPSHYRWPTPERDGSRLYKKAS